MSIARRAFLKSAGASAAGAIMMPYVARGADAITLRMSTPDGVTHPNSVAVERFSSLVKAKTNGAVTVRLFPDAQLGTMANAVSGMQLGTIDLAITSPGLFEGLFPQMGALALPFVFPNEARAEAVLDGAIGTKLFDDLPSKGVYGLCWSTYGWRITQTRDKVIREPKDFAGVKIRLPTGPVLSDTFKTLGAIPTVVDASELYLAVSQGTVDAFEVPFLSLVASKWYEVVKHVALTNHSYNALFLGMSKRRMDALPAAHQTAIREAAAETKAFWRGLVVEKSQECRTFIEGRGITVNECDPKVFRAAVASVYERYKQKAGGPFLDQLLRETEI